MKQELSVLHAVDHPYIVRVLDLCEDDKNYFIVLELIRNGNLEDVLDNLKKKGLNLKESDVAKVISHILKALKYLHNQNIIHRDLKP